MWNENNNSEIFFIILKIKGPAKTYLEDKKSHLDFNTSSPSSAFSLMAHSCITFPLVHAHSQRDLTAVQENEHVGWT